MAIGKPAIDELAVGHVLPRPLILRESVRPVRIMITQKVWFTMQGDSPRKLAASFKQPNLSQCSPPPEVGESIGWARPGMTMELTILGWIEPAGWAMLVRIRRGTRQGLLTKHVLRKCSHTSCRKEWLLSDGFPLY